MYKGSIEVLTILKTKDKLSISALASETGFNQDTIRRVVEGLKEEGYVNLSSEETISFVSTNELNQYLSSEFPEKSVYKKAKSGLAINDLSQVEKSIGVRWAKQKGFVSIEGGKLVPTKSDSDVDSQMDQLSNSSKLLIKGFQISPEVREELIQRKLIEKKSSKEFIVQYSGKLFDVSAISDEFDVSVESAKAPIGKAHPISIMSSRMRTIMSEMGFSEMTGDIVESSFWNFDALFQPQDHPAREMADTFYVSGEYPLPEDRKLVDRVSAAHEKGWKYKWSPKEATKRVLRTHTTCLSARYISQIKDNKPRKHFAIGRVFRNEATDYKHLAEFHQVEGIIAWEGAKFTDLLGTLKEFYSKLGFDKIRFRPSFFPYTEPSLEVDVYFEPRQQWMEIGGAGMFRPEVSMPLCGVYPVLAWGLSLERPLMMMLNLDDIRTFYRNDMEFLKSSRLDV